MGESRSGEARPAEARPSSSLAGLAPEQIARSLSAARDAALAEGLSGHGLRERLCAEYDRRLALLLDPVSLAQPGVALVAVGGLGRREAAPYSDLDLVLVSDDPVPPELAEQLWYLLWDSGLDLDHATRTVDECLAVARDDLPALLGLLWARPVAGDAEVAVRLRERVRQLWRAEARGRLGELDELCRRRWELAGDGASALEPDLKLARGGLRDGQVLEALAVAQLADFRAELRRAHALLLDVRGELHRQAGRRGDVLRRQYQQAVAEALGGRSPASAHPEMWPELTPPMGSSPRDAGGGAGPEYAGDTAADDVLRTVSTPSRRQGRETLSQKRFGEQRGLGSYGSQWSDASGPDGLQPSVTGPHVAPPTRRLASDAGGGAGPEYAGATAADDVLRAVNLACRALGHEVDGALRRIAAAGSLGSPRRAPGGRSHEGRVPLGPVVRRPLARDLVDDGGEIALARSARVGTDPLLMTRAARVASESGLPLAPYLIRRFAERTAPPPTPWPAELRTEFVRLLAGPAVLDVLQTLDLAGLMPTMLPAWAAVRGRAQHSPVHRHTVDRHLMDTVAEAGALVRDVARPDLLLIAALLHDIGKTGGGDHSVVGAPIAENAALAMGFDADDAAVIGVLVRHHLLLVDTATGRDLTDPRTVTDLLAAIDGRLDVLDLLYALTQADARATGSAAWTTWRADLVADLVRRARRSARGLPLPVEPTLPLEWQETAETTDLAVLFGDEGVTIIALDARGVLGRMAGVLALHGLQVRAATVRTHAGRAVDTFQVDPVFGELPAAAVLRGDLARALADGGDLAARLERKERDYRQDAGGRQPPVARWLEDAATDATVVEVRADWSIGSLYRVTSALEHCGLDVRAARVRTWGNAMTASFYVNANVPDPVRSTLAASLTTIR